MGADKGALVQIVGMGINLKANEFGLTQGSVSPVTFVVEREVARKLGA
jgi:hypothetical protein